MVSVVLEKQQVSINNIYCIGRNYVDHIAELKNETPTEPVVFMKPNNSVLNAGGIIRLPEYSSSVHYECELVLLVGRDEDGNNEADIMGCVAGYAVGLDLTARDVQGCLKEKGLPWTKAKGFRNSACVSDFIAAQRLSEPQNCSFSLHVNGVQKQHGQTSHMIYSLPQILADLAKTYGLKQGDVVYTGTPAGVGQLNTGDKLHLALEDLVNAEFIVG
ncbi:fumarylacetoacetate hydrolase family protein [Neisseria weaveri]|uniref:fumarylacetoacetate hydrolase family protein n=1 Tax=Neisseria weaveri TaxID=28091 RepID=UPI000D304E26|nr:fumarylacetoacetate hydrolase family protein [Neisseria weaveri]